MSELLKNFETVISGEVDLKEYFSTERETLTYTVISHLPMDTLLKFRSALDGKSIEESYRVIGQVVHTKTKIPIPTLDVQLWDRDISVKGDDFLGSSLTDPEGKFEIFYSLKSAGIRDFPDLELRFFDPPQPAIVNDTKIQRVNLIEVVKGKKNVKTSTYDFGQIELDYYEYDEGYKDFPYCLPSSIRHE